MTPRWKPSRHRPQLDWPIGCMQLRGKKCLRFNQCLVGWQPDGRIDCYCGHYPAILTVDSHEVAFFDSSLCEYNFICDGRQANRFDVDTKLSGPKCRKIFVGSTIRWITYHVVSCNLCLLYSVAPMFNR